MKQIVCFYKSLQQPADDHQTEKSALFARGGHQSQPAHDHDEDDDHESLTQVSSSYLDIGLDSDTEEDAHWQNSDDDDDTTTEVEKNEPVGLVLGHFACRTPSANEPVYYQTPPDGPKICVSNCICSHLLYIYLLI